MKISHFYNICYLSNKCLFLKGKKHSPNMKFVDFKCKIGQRCFDNFVERMRNEVGWQK
jgi:hypothetical protein